MRDDSHAQCSRVRGMLADYSVGALGTADRERVRRHIEACGECARELHALRHTAVILERATLEDAPDRWDAVRASLAPRESPTGIRSFPWSARYRLRAAIAATVAVAAIAGAYFMTGRESAEIQPDAIFADHASMSWREPFADRAALGLTHAVSVGAESENLR